MVEKIPQGWVHEPLAQPVLLFSGENTITIRHDVGLFEVRSVVLQYMIDDSDTPRNLWAQITQDGTLIAVYENISDEVQNANIIIAVYNPDGVQMSSEVFSLEGFVPGDAWNVGKDINAYRFRDYYFRVFVLGRDFTPLAVPAQGFIV